MMPSIFSKTSLQKLLSMQSTTLTAWEEKGLVRPMHIGRGPGSRVLFSLADALKISLARELRKRGATLDLSLSIVAWLHGKTIEQLEAEFEADRRFLLIVDNRPMGRLMTKQSVDELSVDLSKSVFSLSLLCINLEEAVSQLKLKLSAIEEAEGKIEPVRN